MSEHKFNRQVKYINRDFAEYRQLLVNYAKNYFPNTYKDFNESSPGMMFIEMASMVGDVISFYGDVQLQESFLHTVDERINLYNLAQGMGYKAKTTVPASVKLDIFQLVPSIGSGTNTEPDYRYALFVESNMECQTQDGIRFRTVEPVDFRNDSALDPRTVSVYSTTSDGAIEYYLLKKQVNAVSGEIMTRTYEFGDPKIYDKITLPEDNVTEIIDIIDSDNNKWYEVDYLAQELVATEVRNIPANDPVLSKHRDSVPFLLCYKQTERRFVTRLRRDDRTEIQFGAGLSQEADEEIIPNPFNVGLGIDYFARVTDVSVDPKNFLYTKTYGSVPADTTLTVRYGLGSGLSDNVNSNTITQIVSIDTKSPLELIDPTILETIRDSITINNPDPAYGGMNRKPIDTIRQEAMANFAAQNRSVTKEDYILRCYTMPAKFGAIAKVYAEQDQQLSRWNDLEKIPNPYAINLYVLAYDGNKNLVTANEAIKENLRQYLRQYRLMTDAINIKDPFIVNIGIEYDIVTRPDQSSDVVLSRCTQRLQELFDNDRMQINRPIFINKLYTELDKIEGVQTVQDIKIVNHYNINQGYSGNVYDIETATRQQILYPSVTPCIFEVKYPNTDIRGRVNDI